MNNIVIFKDLTTEEALQEIERNSEKYHGLIVDMNIPEERKKVKESASVINDILKRIDRARIDKSKAYKDEVETEHGYIKGRLEKANSHLTILIDKYKEERQLILDAEKARKDKIDSIFVKMNESAMQAIGQNSIIIESIMDDLSCIDFSRSIFQERTDEAVKEHGLLMGKLKVMLESQLASEKQIEEAAAMQKRLDDLEAREEAERQRAIAEKQAQQIAEVKRQAEEEAEAKRQEWQAGAEQREKDREAQYQKERAEADELAQSQAMERERQAVQDEQNRVALIAKQEQEEAEKRAANKAHKNKIHASIVKTLIDNGADKEEATKIVIIAAKGLVGNMVITY